MGTISQPPPSDNMETKLIILAFISMASAFPYPYPQAPGPALAYPKAGPNGHYDANIISSTLMLLLPMCLNGVTVVVTTPNISEKNTCPKKHITSKPNCVGEMLMRVKENNSTITTMELMPHPTKHLSTVHPSKYHPTQQPNQWSRPYVVYYLPTQYHRTISSNKFSNS